MHSIGADGIAYTYTARYDDEALCYALFDAVPFPSRKSIEKPISIGIGSGR
jgi:hypothetical protein